MLQNMLKNAKDVMLTCADIVKLKTYDVTSRSRESRICQQIATIDL